MAIVRTAQETALQAWVESILSQYGAVVVFSDQHAPSPAPPFVRVDVRGYRRIGGSQRDVSQTNVPRVNTHYGAEVVLECVGDQARSMATDIVHRSVYDSTLGNRGIFFTSLEPNGFDWADIGDGKELRCWLDGEINFIDTWTDPSGPVGVVRRVRATGTVDDLDVLVEAPPGVPFGLWELIVSTYAVGITFDYVTGGTNCVVLGVNGHAPDGKGHVYVGDGVDGQLVELEEDLEGDLETSGLGGLDTGTVAADKVYVWRLVTKIDGSDPWLLATLAGDTPTLPTGYVQWSAPLAPAVTDGSAEMLVMTHHPDGYFEFDDAVEVTTDGVETVRTAVGTTRALSTVVPEDIPTPRVWFRLEADNSDPAADLRVERLHEGVYCEVAQALDVDAPVQFDFWTLLEDTDLDAGLYYTWSAAPVGGATLSVRGYWL